ncbi:MAG: DUF4304 domain-containing protein [Candidatus Obscuribacterales bacterium]
MNPYNAADVISRVLEPEGFIRDRFHWYRETPDHFYYLTLSRVNGDDFIDIRYSAKKYLTDGATFQYKWQATEHVHELLDLHGALTYSFEFGSLTPEERTQRLEKCLCARALPLLHQFSTLDGFKEFDPVKIVGRFLKPEGFKKDGNYWYKETADHFYFLQLYSVNNSKYIDIGVSFKQFIADGKTYKSMHHGSMRIHETAVLKGAFNYWHEYRTLSQKERVVLLESAMRDPVMPLLKKISTLSGVRDLFLADGVNFHVLKECRHVVGLPA